MTLTLTIHVHEGKTPERTAREIQRLIWSRDDVYGLKSDYITESETQLMLKKIREEMYL